MPVFAGLLVLLVCGHVRASDIVARYAVFAHDPLNDRTVLLVRAVIDGADAACPALTVDGDEAVMAPRDNPDATHFPVSVCEAVVAVTSNVELAGDRIPTLAGYDGGDLHLILFGDTGCKGPPKQDCAKAWPFPGIAADAAGQEPDLVVQVGDWDYLGTPSKSVEGKSGYDGCLPADGGPLLSLAELSDWSTWYRDVFAPAAPLFEAAPWVVTRGNHELCSRGGQGWFYLLDPHSKLLDPYHAVPSCYAPTVATDPYPLQIGGLSLIVVDDVNACDNRDWQADAAWDYQTRTVAPVVDRVEQLARHMSGPVWMVSHRPLWAALRFEENGPLIEGSLAWQLALANSLEGKLPDNVALVVSGHVHDAQWLVFDGDRPPQLIAGNGGTVLDENHVARPVDLEIDGMAATGWVVATPGVTHGFGYFDLELTNAADWRGRMHAYWPDGRPVDVDLLDCAMPVRDGMLCSLP